MGVLGLTGRHVQGGANLLEGEVPFGVKFGQDGGEVVAAGLEVDGAGQAKVTHRVARARVGVTRVSDGADGRAKFGLGGLFAKDVTPLERAGGRFDLPRWLKRRDVGGFVGVAHIIQHHHQHVLAVGRARADVAVLEAVDDEAGRVAVDGPVVLDLGRGQHGGPGGLDRSIGVVLHFPLTQAGLLAHQ